MIKRNDIIMGVLVLFVALVSLGVFIVTQKEGSRVLITVNGKEFQTLELNQNVTINVDGEEDGHNTVVIEGGYVWMSEADCPDELCVKHNKIHYNHETIVCLPHKVVVEIVNGETNSVDIIAK